MPKSERLRTVNASLEDPKVWNDPKKAQELGREKKSLDDVVVTLDGLTSELLGQHRALRDVEGRRRHGRPATLDDDAAKLEADIKRSNSAACSTTRPIR